MVRVCLLNVQRHSSAPGPSSDGSAGRSGSGRLYCSTHSRGLPRAAQTFTGGSGARHQRLPTLEASASRRLSLPRPPLSRSAQALHTSIQRAPRRPSSGWRTSYSPHRTTRRHRRRHRPRAPSSRAPGRRARRRSRRSRCRPRRWALRGGVSTLTLTLPLPLPLPLTPNPNPNPNPNSNP